MLSTLGTFTLVDYERAHFSRDTLESIFVEHKVDILLVGHWHAYERIYPIYKYVLAEFVSRYRCRRDKLWGTNYTNAPYPLQVVNGVGGCREGSLSVEV